MNGMIAAGDPRTAAAGRRILDEGGNAVDAAVAAAFVSFTSEIAMVHWGGSGLATIYDPAAGQARVYDFFSNMPGLGLDGPLDERPLDFHRTTVDFGVTTQDFYVGRGSVAVPANLFGLCRLLREHGRLSLEQVLAPAHELAGDGFPIDRYQAETCRLLYPIFTHTEEMRAIFAPDGRFIEPGDRLFIPHLAETLAVLAAEGEAFLRGGRLGQALLADQAARGGLLTQADLDRYEVAVLEPIRVTYRGHEVLLPPPCSSGGVLTAFALKLLGRFDLARSPHGSANHLQLLAEVMAATTRARRHWEEARGYLEPAQAVDHFLNEDFVADFASEVLMAVLKGRPSTIIDEAPGPANTTHISVVDGAGMAVSITTTAGESAGYIVPGTGFIPNNMLGEEDLFPEGFHRLAAGRRIYSMMTPVVALRDGQTRLVVGSGGSIRIRSAVLQAITNVIDYDFSLQAAIDAPRVHLERRVLQCEGGCDPAALDELESLGYRINRWPGKSMYFGGAHSVGYERGQWVAAGDHRRHGSTA